MKIYMYLRMRLNLIMAWSYSNRGAARGRQSRTVRVVQIMVQEGRTVDGS